MTGRSTTSAGTVAAIDLGATSGRVILGRVGPGVLETTQVARFANTPLQTPAGMHWNLTDLYGSALEGLRAAVRDGAAIASIGVDSWAVDYVRLRAGESLAEPFHYRDERTTSGVSSVHAVRPFEELYDRNGLQFLPFNTLYQLAAERTGGGLDGVERILLIPDAIGFRLTGLEVTERTNASTTGLLAVRDGQWDAALMLDLGFRPEMFAPLVDPGTVVGGLRAEVARDVGASPDVIAVGSHDTASAVVAVPMTDPQTSAYISCGTWGLVGVELERPVLTEAARLANFTNEGGVDGRVRFLHNVMGLWLLTESVTQWERDSGERIDLPALLASAARVPEGAVEVFDANDPVFLPAGDMPARIVEWYGQRGLRAPRGHAETTRAIIESLASAFAEAVRRAAELAGYALATVHIVGGGSLNELLCQRVADRTGLPVLAGPVEATALGNVLVQARALGLLGAGASLESLRDLVRLTHAPRRYTPA